MRNLCRSARLGCLALSGSLASGAWSFGCCGSTVCVHESSKVRTELQCHLSAVRYSELGLVIKSRQQSYLVCSKRIWASRVMQFVSLGALLLHFGPINVITPVIRTPVNHASLSKFATLGGMRWKQVSAGV